MTLPAHLQHLRWADSPHLIQIWCDNGREQVTALPIRLDLKEILL